MASRVVALQRAALSFPQLVPHPPVLRTTPRRQWRGKSALKFIGKL